MAKVLITGASGLIGGRLQQLLLAKGYDIHTIGRGRGTATDKRVRHFQWDITAKTMDPKALDGVSALIHLAGAGVADKRWTDARKKEIYDSRINSSYLLYETLRQNKHQVETIVSASAVGIYGDCGGDTVKEDRQPADTFLAKVTKDWEAAVARFETIGIRHACCRIGIVLAKGGGALPELERTIPFGVAGYFAKDPLYYPWVHIDDVCGIMIHALENKPVKGSYNTTAPNPAPIKDLVKAIVKAKGAHAILAPVPYFALRTAMGEMADMLYSSQKCSDEKISKTGYVFRFPELSSALANIYAS